MTHLQRIAKRFKNTSVVYFFSPLIFFTFSYHDPASSLRQEWFADGNATSRATELPLSSTALFSDTSLRNAIHEWEETALQLIMKSDITPLHYKYPHNEAPTFNHATLIGSGSFNEARLLHIHPCSHTSSAFTDVRLHCRMTYATSE